MRATPALSVFRTREGIIAVVAVLGVAVHVAARLAGASTALQTGPLLGVLAGGGLPLVWDLAGKAWRRQFGADMLAGLSIVTSVLLGEYLAGALVVLMLSGGEALEHYAVGRASSVLQALAKRLPSVAHRRVDGRLEDVALDAIRIDDRLVVLPHEICPVDGVVDEGQGVMDESYLTGEPFLMPKAPGATVFSGAINGEHALTIRAVRLAVDSRYARIMRVMRDSEQRRPALRRLGDQLGAWYTPLALAIAGAAWVWTGDPVRFLAVLVVATPCPLLIAIPVAIIGAVSLAATRGIVIRDPAILETVDRCRTMVLDKTGTLTYGQPTLTLEQYSKHPLARPILEAAAAARVVLADATSLREAPGQGLVGTVHGREVRILGRRQAEGLGLGAHLPAQQAGLECVVLVDGVVAATYRFRDAPRADSRAFIGHLGARHQLSRVLIVSGDRASEVRYLADQVGIGEVHAPCTPEEKVAITRAETEQAPTIFLGDGINDAPALLTATVGLAFGHQNEITADAAGAVIMEPSLARVDELLHIAGRLRRIALQSAVGGMIASVAGMALAAAGLLPPVSGAIAQEIIDLAAVLNALRASRPGGALTDY